MEIKMNNRTLCSDTLSKTEKQDILSYFSWHTWSSELRFLPQYSSKKLEFDPAWQIAESSNRERQEFFFTLFLLCFVSNFSYWNWTEQKVRWAWIQKKGGFDLKEGKNWSTGSTHIARLGEVMSYS